MSAEPAVWNEVLSALATAARSGLKELFCLELATKVLMRLARLNRDHGFIGRESWRRCSIS